MAKNENEAENFIKKQIGAFIMLGYSSNSINIFEGRLLNERNYFSWREWLEAISHY